MSQMVKLVSLLVAASQLASGHPALSSSSSSWCPAWFDDIAPRWLAASPSVPNIQMTIWSPGCGNLHCKGAWNSPNFTTHPPLLVNTPSRLASVTKPFTALAVLKLVEEGVIDINGSVTDYLPDWGVATLEKRLGGAELARQVTPWMLLHHTSGIGMTGWAQWQQYILSDPLRTITHRETLEWHAENAPAVGTPGSEFRYSDGGYVYLGLLNEYMRGPGVGLNTSKTMAAAVREVAHMDDLGMSSTYWDVYEQPPPGVPPRAAQYAGDIDATDVNGGWINYGGTGLVSTAEDLVKFARAFHKGHLLGREGMEMVYTTVPTNGRFDGDGYGCAWAHDVLAGYDAWFHRGAFGAWLYYLPELDLAISGTVNQQSEETGVRPYILEIVQNVVDDRVCCVRRSRTML